MDLLQDAVVRRAVENLVRVAVVALANAMRRVLVAQKSYVGLTRSWLSGK